MRQMALKENELDNTNWLHLPSTWGALWPIISSPATAGIVISIALEQWGWIQNKDVPNIRKLGVVFLACLTWGAFIIIAASDFVFSMETLKVTIFSIIMMGVGITAASQLGYLLIQGIPWLRDILTVLFGAGTKTSTSVSVRQQSDPLQPGISSSAVVNTTKSTPDSPVAKTQTLIEFDDGAKA